MQIEQRLTTDDREAQSQSLIKAYRTDPACFMDLYQLWLEPVFYYYLRLTGHRETAEDLTADFFLKLLNGLSKYKSKGRFTSWLFTVAHNLAMDHFRWEKRFMETMASENEPNENLSCPSGTSPDDVILLRQCLAKLNHDDQELIHLRYHEGLSYAQIGEVVGRREQTVKKAVYRILNVLSNEIGVNHE